MAKLSIVGNAVVLTSTLPLEDIKLVEKYNKSALTITEEVDGEKTPVFAIGTGKKGEISQYGATFADATRDENKFAQITLCACAEGITGDVKDWAADKFGKAMTNLKKLEAAIPAVIEQIAADKAAVVADITVVQ